MLTDAAKEAALDAAVKQIDLGLENIRTLSASFYSEYTVKSLPQLAID